jgi:putative flippase GtrA
MRRQLVSFGVVGLVSNGLAYALYLTLTSVGVGHKTAMTLVFGASVASTYALNRRWTFDYGAPLARSSQRYVGVYALAYIANLAALALLVDAANLPHRAVMLALTVATACVMFVLQKFWVFSPMSSEVQQP